MGNEQATANRFGRLVDGALVVRALPASECARMQAVGLTSAPEVHFVTGGWTERYG